jgi:hypothetical protein
MMCFADLNAKVLAIPFVCQSEIISINQMQSEQMFETVIFFTWIKIPKFPYIVHKKKTNLGYECYHVLYD